MFTKKSMGFLTGAVTLCAVGMSGDSVSAEWKQPRAWVRRLQPSTGFNSDCNTPMFKVPAPLPPDAHQDFVGLYNPAAPPSGATRNATHLQAQDCHESGDQEVATVLNPEFLKANGAPEPDTRLVNLRTNEVPKVAAPDGSRLFLGDEGTAASPVMPTNSVPSDPLTLDQFRAVDGVMFLKCRSDGTARVRIELRNYAPNEILTVWATWLSTPPGGSAPMPMPMPFGGVPNAVVADEDGSARFVRELSFCPMDILADGSRLMWLDIASHLDGGVYGAMPDVPMATTKVNLPGNPATSFESPISMGTITVNRGAIRMAVDPQ